MVSLTCTALLEIQKMAFEKERRELREAAEFESRVAATLADIYAELDFDYGCHDCPVWRPCSELGHENCKFMILKYARLQVEEEMDAEMDK